jgi:hypothetical protein
MKLSSEAVHDIVNDHEAMAALQIFRAHMRGVGLGFGGTQLVAMEETLVMRRLLDDVRSGKLAEITANVIVDGCDVYCRHVDDIPADGKRPQP